MVGIMLSNAEDMAEPPNDAPKAAMGEGKGVEAPLPMLPRGVLPAEERGANPIPPLGALKEASARPLPPLPPELPAEAPLKKSKPLAAGGAAPMALAPPPAKANPEAAGAAGTGAALMGAAAGACAKKDKSNPAAEPVAEEKEEKAKEEEVEEVEELEEEGRVEKPKRSTSGSAGLGGATGASGAGAAAGKAGAAGPHRGAAAAVGLGVVPPALGAARLPPPLPPALAPPAVVREEDKLEVLEFRSSAGEAASLEGAGASTYLRNDASPPKRGVGEAR